MKQIFVVRKDLNMRKGKIGAQTAHASNDIIFQMINDGNIFENNYFIRWKENYMKKITLGVDTLDELMNIYNEAKTKIKYVSLIEDLGFTEFKDPTITCIGIGPDDETLIDTITKNLKCL